MRKILLDIFHGNITPNEKVFKKDPEYIEAAKTLSDSEAHLKSILTDEGKAHLDAYDKAHYEISSFDMENAFIEGFCMGAKVILAIFSTEDDPQIPMC